MSLTDPKGRSHRPPLVLREVEPRRAALARTFCGLPVTAVGTGIWWELSDPVGLEDEPPQAVVVGLRRSAEVFELLHVVLGEDAGPETASDVADQVVVTLRRTEADVVRASVTDEPVRAALVAAGFEEARDEEGTGLLLLRL